MKDKIKRQFCDMWQDLPFWDFLRYCTFCSIILLSVMYFDFSFLPYVFTPYFNEMDSQFVLSLLLLLFFYLLFSWRCSGLEHLRTVEAECNYIVDLLRKKLDDFDVLKFLDDLNVKGGENK